MSNECKNANLLLLLGNHLIKETCIELTARKAEKGSSCFWKQGSPELGKLFSTCLCL